MPTRPSFVMTPEVSRVTVGAQPATGVGEGLAVGEDGAVGEAVAIACATAEPAVEQAASSRSAMTFKTRTASIQGPRERVPCGFCENRHIRRGGT